MTIAGAIYPQEVPEESATKRMLSFSSYFPHNIYRDGKVELGTTTAKYQASLLSPSAQMLVLIDGNLYNQSEIDREIQSRGHHRPLQNDQERIALLYSIHQENAISYLNGNFVLAIYDLQKQELLLARDRIGEKTLYWTLRNDLFLFANSLKGILSSDLIPQTPDLEALSFFISFGFIPQEKSPIQGVFKLQPGHYLKVSREKNLLIRPYWSYNSFLTGKKSSVTEKEFRTAADKAWEKRVASSSELLCYVERGPVTEISTNFPLKFFSPQTPLTAEAVLSDLDAMVWQLDEPVADLSIPKLWHCCKAMQADGCKELFFLTGSIPFFEQEIRAPRIFFSKSLQSFQHNLKQKILIPLLSRLHQKSVYEMLRSIHTHPWHVAFLNQNALFDKKDFRDLHSQLLKPVNNEIFLHRFPALERLGPTYSSLMYLYHKIKLPAAVLLPEENFCTHFGITRKAPYLDHEVIELLASIPDVDSHFSYVKMFNSPTPVSRACPLPQWAADLANRKLTEKFSKSILVESGLFSLHWITEQMKNFNRHPNLFFQELWGLLVLETWFRLFIEGKITRPTQYRKTEANT